MNITIKKIAVYPRLSEETTAYNADVYIDGLKSYAASNDGHGGCDCFHPYPGGVKHPDFEELEDCVARLLAEHHETKRLRRLMKTKLVAIEGGKLLSFNRKPTPENIKLFKRTRPAATVVETDKQVAEAVALLVAA